MAEVGSAFVSNLGAGYLGAGIGSLMYLYIYDWPASKFKDGRSRWSAQGIDVRIRSFIWLWRAGFCITVHEMKCD